MRLPRRRRSTLREDSPIRVVYLDHCARLSGAELGLLRLLPTLSQVEPHVILAEGGPLVDRLVARGISVEVLPMKEESRGLARDDVRIGSLPLGSIAFTALYIARLTLRISRLRPHLVQSNSLKSALYGGIAARLAGIPFVWHSHDRISNDYLPDQAVRLVHLAARWLPNLVIADAQASLTTLGKIRSPTAIVRWPIADDVRALSTREGRRESGRPLRFGIVGRIAPWKGQHVFLEAFARAFPDGNEHAVLIGAPLFGEDEYERALHDQTLRLGIGDRVDFMGFREDVGSQLADLDVLVHASTIAEPFGQVVVEGMAAGLPVVAAGAGGPAEVITNGKDGILHDPGDPEALAKAMRALALDPVLREQLGREARKTASLFGPDRIAEEVITLYRSLIRWPSG